MANEISPVGPSQTTVADAAANSEGQALPPHGGRQAMPVGGSSMSELLRNPRVVIAIAAVLIGLGIAGLVYWSSKPTYRLLFSGMSESEASQVVSLLQKEHVPYQLQGPNMVMVPSDRVYELRLKLAGQGVTPGQGVGYEIFDKDFSFNATDFTRRVNLQRALQGELARTIQVLPNVASARVHIVMPKDSAFLKRQRKASASVMVKLVGNQTLSQETITAIQNLVAASVPELEPEKVTIVDSSGHLLSTHEDGRSGSLTASQKLQEYQHKIESGLEKRLTTMLEQIVGPGQAIVRVAADLDRHEVERQVEQYNPDEVVIRSENQIEDKHVSKNVTAAGVPGVASNTPGQNPLALSDSGPSEEGTHQELVRNYEISTTKEHLFLPSGSIKRLSIAVVVGGHMKKNEDGTTEFQPMDAARLASIRALVARAAGINEERGDSLEIQSMPLVDITSDVDTEALEEAEQRAFVLQLIRYAVAALAMILIAWFLLRPMANRLLANRKPESLPPSENAKQLDLEDLKALTAEPVMSPVDKVRLILESQPERATQVLQEWVRDA